MRSPNDLIREQSLPLGDSITLTKETAAGFFDRANHFQTRSNGTFLADRWISGFFNVRTIDPEKASEEKAASEASPYPTSSHEMSDGNFTLRTVTVRGFVARGGRFIGSGEGGSMADQLISDWFNFREARKEVAEA